MSKHTLDFIVIGAQKAGTTSLFKYMETHPQLYMPPEKECLYFNDDERFSRGWGWYIDEFFNGAPPDRLWGTVTPHYMIDPRVPERIKDTLPDVKLIALLRNPINRAYSHHLMSVRRGYETRSFEDAVYELLKPDALEEARKQPTETNGYIVIGEYGRILTKYYERFPHQQIFVSFTEELGHSPEQVLQTIFHFLGVDPGFVPPNLGVVYHQGGGRRRLPWGDRLKRAGFVRSLWRMMLPEKKRRFFRYWFEQWNIVPDEEGIQIPLSVQELLTRHYEEDVRKLSTLIDREVPWITWA
jgi:hypothetical protein